MKIVLPIILLFFLLNSCSEDFEIPESWSDGIYTTNDNQNSELCMFHYDLSGRRWFYLGIRDSAGDDSLFSIHNNTEITDNLGNDSSELERIIRFTTPQTFTYNGKSTILHSMRIRQQTVFITITQEAQRKEIPLYKRSEWIRKKLPEGRYKVEIDSQTIFVNLKQDHFSSYTLNISDEQSRGFSYRITDNLPAILGDSLWVFTKHYTVERRDTRALQPYPTIYTLNDIKYTGFQVVLDSGKLFFEAQYRNFYDTVSYNSGYQLMVLDGKN